METLISFASAPFLGYLLSTGIKIGGVWAGLPFMACAIATFLILGFIFAYRIQSQKTMVWMHHRIKSE